MMVRGSALYFFFFFFFFSILVGSEVSAAGRSKRQFSISFGLPNFSIGGGGGGGGGGASNNNGGGGDGRQDPFQNFLGQAIGNIFNQVVRPPPNNHNNNQGNNNQGSNNQGNGNNNPGGVDPCLSGNVFGIPFGFGQTRCDINNGCCEQGCRQGRRQARCFCQNGFFLRQDGRTCEDVNECQLGNNGGCAQTCNNTPGSFTCSCSQGTLNPDQRTCSAGGAGGGSPTGPVESCNVNNGGCSQMCVQNGFRVQCACVPGFSLGRDGKTCLQVDQCVNGNGGCEEICSNVGGQRVCSCGPGKQLANDGVRCRDINECEVNNGGCEQQCRNTPGSFVCECRAGFTLAPNGLQCQANQLPITEGPQPIIVPGTDDSGCGVNLKKSLITRIVGGKPADPKDWPWMAALLQRSGNTQYCGGSLITDRHVLTAAHCMKPFSAQEILVRLGEYDFSNTNDNSPNNFNVAEVRMHERYDSNTQENDIALLKLDRVAVFNEFIKPACLPPPGRSFAGNPGIVTGWGTIYSGGPVSNVLQEVIVPVWQPDECSTAYPGKIFSGMMCAGTKTGGKDSCQGDSGGPFQVQILPNRRWFIAGIVSWGIGCARPEKPGVYTEVTQYLDWIKTNARP